MATAKLRSKTIMTPITQEVVEGVTLKLSNSEAKALRYVLGLVGGPHDLINSISRALAEEGFEAKWNWQRTTDGEPEISEGRIQMLSASIGAFE